MTGFGRILADLNRAEVRYVLVGGIALIRHGVVRATRDIDAVLEPGEENLDRVRKLILAWGAMKRIASRERDLADLSELQAAHGELPDSREDDPSGF